MYKTFRVLLNDKKLWINLILINIRVSDGIVVFFIEGVNKHKSIQGDADIYKKISFSDILWEIGSYVY